MVYVFHVEKGLTHILPMNIIVENVNTLKSTLAGLTGIDSKRQVLLISGGEVLVSERKVGSYHAGTDTNPIFLFNAGVGDVGGGISSSGPSTSSVTGGMDVSGLGDDATSRGHDAVQSVDAVLNMPYNANGIAARIQLAQGFKEMALKDENLCRRIVQQQHMQHQGWAAVIANLEDCTSAFMTARTIFEKSYRRFVSGKEQHWPFIQTFVDNDMSLLRRIPIFTCFAPWRSYAGDAQSAGAGISENLPNFRPEHFNTAIAALQSPELEDDVLESPRTSSNGPPSASTLKDDSIQFYSMLEWINQASHCTVESLINNCVSALHAIDESDVLEELLEDSTEIAERASATEMKQVKGLSDRLFGLEQLQIELSKLAKIQTETVHAFVQSCSAAAIGVAPGSPSFGGGMDSQSLPARDISFMSSASSSPTPTQRGGGPGSRVGSPGAVFVSSAEDVRQAEILRRMQHAHKKIGDIRARCASAKDELCLNLSSRLRWVVFVERNMAELNAKLAMHTENFKRIRRAFILLEQIHNAPRLYVVACYEIVRRKRFSTQYERWAREISQRAFAIWEHECTHRRKVAEQLDEHFLRSVVDGLFYDAPQFAQNVPSDLCRHLPATLGERELAELRRRVPELYDLVEKQFVDDNPSFPDNDLRVVEEAPSTSMTENTAAVSPTNEHSSGRTVIKHDGMDKSFSTAPTSEQTKSPKISSESAEDRDDDELDNEADAQSVEQFEMWHDGDGEVSVESATVEKRRDEHPSDSETERYVAVTLPLPSSSAGNASMPTETPLRRRFNSIISDILSNTPAVLARSTSIDAVLAADASKGGKKSKAAADTERLVRSAMQQTMTGLPRPAVVNIDVDAADTVRTEATLLSNNAKLPTNESQQEKTEVQIQKILMVDAATETNSDDDQQVAAAVLDVTSPPETSDFSTQTLIAGSDVDQVVKQFDSFRASAFASNAARASTRESLQDAFSNFRERIRATNIDLRDLHQQYTTEADNKIKILHTGEVTAAENKLLSVQAELHEANQQLTVVRDQLRDATAVAAAASASLLSVTLPPQQIPVTITGDIPPSMEASLISLASSVRTGSLPQASGVVAVQLPLPTEQIMPPPSSPPIPPRVSVLTCQPDELVFITFNADAARFVVFQLNRAVPFIVDPKSYAELGLVEPIDAQPRASISETTAAAVDIAPTAAAAASPMVAQVVRKDYCVATKAPNRYRMPLDSRFYRVRLKRFDSSVFPSGTQQQSSSSRPSSFSRQASSSISSLHRQPQSGSNINTQSIYYASSPPGGGTDPSWMRSL